jgi:maltose alpha-D-glucosyltransferase/alpha-amylase
METRSQAQTAGRERASARPRASTADNTGLLTFEAPSLLALLDAPAGDELLALLGEHIRTRRWFRGKARRICSLELLDHLPLKAAPEDLTLCIVRVLYVAEPPELYVLPLAFSVDQSIANREPLFALLVEPAQEEARLGVVYDPTGAEELSQSLARLFLRAETMGKHGRATALPSDELLSRLGPDQPALPARISDAEQSNTSVFLGQSFMLKLFRQLEDGENPDVELNQFLWGRGYRKVPEPLGSVRYHGKDFVSTLGIAQRYVPNRGSAWDLTLAQLEQSFERARTLALPQSAPGLLDPGHANPPESVRLLLGDYLPLVHRLAQRTAELHVALASDESEPAFKPQPFDAHYRSVLAEAASERLQHGYRLLSDQLPGLPDAIKPLANKVLRYRGKLQRKLEATAAEKVHASRIRCHGDYHLGQVLYDGEDFIILDFEGEPAQAIELRRLKRSALYDVCGMLRSFHYAATFALQRMPSTEGLAEASDAWYRWTSALFVGAYLERVRERSPHAVFLPETGAQLQSLLQLHSIDKCSYELAYELNNRPHWVGVPLAGLLSLAGEH